MLVRRLEGVERADRFKRLAGEKAGFSMSFSAGCNSQVHAGVSGKQISGRERERERKTRRERGVDDGRSVVGMS